VATVIARPENPVRVAAGLPGRRFDHLFFSGIAGLMLVTVFVGFAPSYYLAGMIHAPLPSMIIHIHGAVFSLWMVLLVTQISVVSAGRVDVHRRLGVAGFLLACLMLVLGVLAATDSLVRGAGPVGRDPKFFYIIPLSNILIFAVVIFFAYRARSNPSAHKRLILIATTALMVAALARWPFAMVHRHTPVAMRFSYLFLVAIVAYDLWSTRKIQRATLWGSAFLISIQQVAAFVGRTVAWHQFATWVQSLAARHL
jgi:hypothetical protein